MTFYQLAFKYLMRKKAKTLLLSLVFVFISSMILSTSMILRSSQEVENAMQEKMSSKVVAEIKKEHHKILDSDLIKINQLSNVASLNKHAKNIMYPMDFHLVCDREATQDDNVKGVLLSFDELEKDSPFFDGSYKLISGDYISPHKSGIVINTILAETNGLTLHDEVHLKATSDNTVSVKIIGIFQSGNEHKQSTSLSAENRIENQIFIDNGNYRKLYEDEGYDSVSIYSKNPDRLHSLKAQMETILKDTCEFTTSDVLYQQMKAPLKQMIRITSFIRILTLFIGLVIIALLLGMWMRTRQKESAILISLGKTKINIFLQMLLETWTIFIASMIIAIALGTMIANTLQSILASEEAPMVSMDVYVKSNDIISLIYMGGSVVFLAVICSMISIMKTSLKDILSRMEG